MSSDSSRSLLPRETSNIQKMQTPGAPSAGIMPSTTHQNRNQHISQQLITSAFENLNISQSSRDPPQINPANNLKVSKRIPIATSSFCIERGVETDHLDKGFNAAGTHGDRVSKETSQTLQVPDNNIPFAAPGKHYKKYRTPDTTTEKKRRILQQASMEFKNNRDPKWTGWEL